MPRSAGKTCVQSLMHLHTFTPWDIGLLRMLGKFYPSNCSIRQKPSKIHGTFLLWWMRKSVEAAHAAIPKGKCGDTNCAIILNWNVDLSMPIYHNWSRVPQVITRCQWTLCIANYIFCGGPLIPTNIAVLIWHLRLLITIWLHPIMIKQDDMVSDDDMASGRMDHNDDYCLILLTAKCVRSWYIDIHTQPMATLSPSL